MQVPVKFFRMHPDVPKPRYATSGAMCFDFYTKNTHVVEPGQTLIIKSGLKVEIPVGYGMNVVGRSGHGFKFDVRLANCVGKIDSKH